MVFEQYYLHFYLKCFTLFYIIYKALSTLQSTCKNQMSFKVQMEVFFLIAEFERAAKIRKIAVYRFLISLLVPEL